MSLEGEFLVEVAGKSTVLLVLAAAANAVLRRSSAGLRHLIWTAAMASLLMLPVLSRLLPAWPAPVGIVAVQTEANVSAEVTAEDRRTSLSPGRLAWVLWAVGFALLAARTCYAGVRLAGIARRARPWPAAGADVRLSSEVSLPLVCGVWRQVILLPEEARGWSSERLRVALAHERAHLRRQDTRTQFLAHVASALYWPHPLVWYAARCLRREAEQACDESVLMQGQDRFVYARELVEIARSLQSAGASFTTERSAAMKCGAELERRIMVMLRGTAHRCALTAPAAVAVAGLALAVIGPVAALRVYALQSGSLTGVVRDASGALVPQARVTAALKGSHRMEFCKTNANGEFVLAPLPEGAYQVTVAKPGFAVSKLEDIVVKAGGPTRIEIVLNLGVVSERLEVRGEAPTRQASPPQAAVLAAGGRVQPPKLEVMVRPSYPPECKAEGVEGTVLLRAVIGRDGSVLKLEPVNQLVDRRLVKAAIDAVSQWRYQPASLNGEPVEVVSHIEVNFALPTSDPAQK